MLRIQNVLKVIDKRIIGGWKIADVSSHPTLGRYIFTIQCFSPIGVVMDSCTISLERRGTMLKTMTHPTTRSYFFYYNGTETNVCGGADWLGDIDNFTRQLEYIIKEYHNKQ